MNFMLENVDDSTVLTNHAMRVAVSRQQKPHMATDQMWLRYDTIVCNLLKTSDLPSLWIRFYNSMNYGNRRCSW